MSEYSDQWESAERLAQNLDSRHDTVMLRSVHGPLAMTVVMQTYEVNRLIERLYQIADGPGEWEFLTRRRPMGDVDYNYEDVTIYGARDRFDQ